VARRNRAPLTGGQGTVLALEAWLVAPAPFAADFFAALPLRTRGFILAGGLDFRFVVVADDRFRFVLEPLCLHITRGSRRQGEREG
jgi:hypothetical protein